MDKKIRQDIHLLLKDSYLTARDMENLVGYIMKNYEERNTLRSALRKIGVKWN